MKFKFKKGATIGVAQAEMDDRFLLSCYIDSGVLRAAMDTADARMFICGRVGAGKTALLIKIAAEKPKQSVVVSPESLTLSHISNNGVLEFFESIGVRLDPFYKLLWRHALVVELLKKRFALDSEEKKNSFWQRMCGGFSGDKKKERALKYLEQWGDRFWETTEVHVRETTQKIEHELQGAIGASLGPAFSISADGKKSLTEEQVFDIVNRGREVVKSVQIKQLDDVIDWLSECALDDDQRPYYILIDRLDEDWVEADLRYKLILALLDAAKDLFKIRNAKVLVALRRDLLERVFRSHRTAGFQEEKFQSLCLDITWSRKELERILDSRIGQLVREQYTTAPVSLSKLLPKKIGGTKPISYILDRTLLRPRDAISFVNDCLRYCTGQPAMTQKLVISAEKDYSKQRFNSVGDEWYSVYPNLLDFARLLQNRPSRFAVTELQGEQIEEVCFDILSHSRDKDCRLYRKAYQFFEGEMQIDQLRLALICEFYKVGFIGIRKAPSDQISWSHENEPVISPVELQASSKVYIHPTFWFALKTTPVDRRRG